MIFLALLSILVFLVGGEFWVIWKIFKYLLNDLFTGTLINYKKSKDQDLYEEANPIWRDK